MQPRETYRDLPHAGLVALRAANGGDAMLLKRWRAEPSVRRHQPLGTVSVGQLGAELAAQRIDDLHRRRGEKFQWIISHDEEPAGWITLVVTNWDHGLAEVGYALSSRFQNQGLMPRALELLLAEVFLNTAIERLEARCAIDNSGSRKVLEKAGFLREGYLRGYFVLGGRRVDNYLYAILRDDYLESLKG